MKGCRYSKNISCSFHLQNFLKEACWKEGCLRESSCEYRKKQKAGTSKELESVAKI